MKSNVVATTVKLKVVVAVVAPAVPVTVIVVVPVVATGEALNAAETLQLDEGVHVGGLGAKTTLTPVGRADRPNVTAEGVPAVVVADKVSVPEAPPWVIDRLAGDAATVNANVVATMVRLKVVVCVWAPEVPVTVIVVVPVVAVAEAVNAAETLQVNEGVQVGGFGVNTTVTPDGRADRLNVTAAGTPAVVVADKVSVPAAPA